MNTAIVTGANGYIGRNVVKKLLAENINVIAVSRNNNYLPSNTHFISLDLENIHKLVNYNVEADIFYHFAWDGSAGEARADYSLQLMNAQWTADAVKIAKKCKCKRFVGAGSIMEKETIAANLAQGNKPSVSYIYGTGKVAAHFVSKSIADVVGIEHIWPLITNAYGPGELSPRFVNTTIRKIINNESLQFTAATQNYDFVYIDDVAEAFYKIGKYGKSSYEYMIGSSNAKPLKEFLTEMKNKLCPEKELIFGDIPFTGTNLPLTDFDTSITEKDTGFKAKISFADGTYNTMKWLMEAYK